jgi:hypothetical protein
VIGAIPVEGTRKREAMKQANYKGDSLKVSTWTGGPGGHFAVMDSKSRRETWLHRARGCCRPPPCV